MTQKIAEPVSVNLAFDSQTKRVFPKQIVWNNRLYSTRKVGLHHTFRQGRTLFHVFSVVARDSFLRLVLNTENLHWILEEISDGL